MQSGPRTPQGPAEVEERQSLRYTEHINVHSCPRTLQVPEELEEKYNFM